MAYSFNLVFFLFSCIGEISAIFRFDGKATLLLLLLLLLYNIGENMSELQTTIHSFIHSFI